MNGVVTLTVWLLVTVPDGTDDVVKLVSPVSYDAPVAVMMDTCMQVAQEHVANVRLYGRVHGVRAIARAKCASDRYDIHVGTMVVDADTR